MTVSANHFTIQIVFEEDSTLTCYIPYQVFYKLTILDTRHDVSYVAEYSSVLLSCSCKTVRIINVYCPMIFGITSFNALFLSEID